jgi:hypothetical protein
VERCCDLVSFLRRASLRRAGRRTNRILLEEQLERTKEMQYRR